MAGASAQELNPTEGSLLGFLHDGPKTGWELLQQVREGLQRFWNVTSSHIYRELKVLEDRGLIEAGPRGARDRQPYTITPAGKAAFAEWIARDPGHEQMRIPLLVSLWFGRHIEPETLRGFLAEHRAHHEQRLATYRELDAGVPAGEPYVAAVVRFGIEYEEAVLRWLDDLHLPAG